MKLRNVATMLVCAVLISAFLGCSGAEKESVVGVLLKGEHELRRLVEYQKTETRVSGGFFLIFGSMSSESKSSPMVTFSWRMNDGVYAISTLRLEKLRVAFDESREIPTIKFRWAPHGRSSGYIEPQNAMDYYVKYAVITCRSKDWPIKIQMPLGG